MDTYNDLLKSIEHWNAFRVPILRISQPDKNLFFQGAMKFYFQEKNSKVSTKCVNVTSANTTKDVIDLLIEKFRPDMRMLSMPEYGLYEIHENGEERKLKPTEKPLFVQLEWNKDDREGRFLLRRMDEKTDMYNELPETSFTRSISNPEAVMRRRRAQKLEKRLQEFSLEGAGGTLRIFGESINKDIAYKTILVSNRETAAYVVKQTLEKYGKDKEDPSNYCLIQVVVPQEADNLSTSASLSEFILDDDDCPLSIHQNHDTSKGILTFHIRRKPADYHKKRKKKPSRSQVQPNPLHPLVVQQLNQRLQLNNNNSEQYSDQNSPPPPPPPPPSQMIPNNNNHYPTGQHQQQHFQQYVPATGANDQILPALIQVKEDVEDIFLSRVITHIMPDTAFRLAPTYVLYMVSRYRASTLFHPELQAPQRAELFVPFTRKIATMIRSTIEAYMREPAFLAFWLSNSSDLSHFYKQDKHLSHFTIDAQEILYDSIKAAFRYLLNCKQHELDSVLYTFFDKDDQFESTGPAHYQQKSISDTPAVNQILNVLNDTMANMRKNRVNPALTIQIFSHLFHHISKWLFDRLIGVYDRNTANNFAEYCTRPWGERLYRRLIMIVKWAEKQGLEQAADFHLARVLQVTLFLARRYPPDVKLNDIIEVYESCHRLNPVQKRALLQRYKPESPNVDSKIKNLIYTEGCSFVGGDHQLEEDFELKIPFLIPDDGYSAEMIRYIPNGLLDFVSYLSKIRVGDQELCIFTVQPTSSGYWTVYFKNHHTDTPDIIDIQLRKKNNSMGLSIIAARGINQDRLGIYIKTVLKNGAAMLDGRLQAGDQLLEVDGNSLLDITQETAAELMQRTGPVVTLKLAKQAAIFHNLSDVINSVPNQPAVHPQAVLPPPNFAQVPQKMDLVQHQIPMPNRKLLQPPNIHPPPPMPTVERLHLSLTGPELQHDSRFVHFQPHQMHQQNLHSRDFNIANSNGNHHAEKVHQVIQPERQVHFQPPPPQTLSYQEDDYQTSQPNLTLNNNPTSPPKSPKKVSWVDTQPHQSLHTLIPPSPSLIPSPTNAQEPSPPNEIVQPPNNENVKYREDFIQSLAYNNNNFIHDQSVINTFGVHRSNLDQDLDDEEDDDEDDNDDDEDEENNNTNLKFTQNGQDCYDERHQQALEQNVTNHDLNNLPKPPSNAPNGQPLDTTTESLTLEDIDEVLSSKTHNNWLEDSSGVIGTQEVYNDPRQRIVKERERPNEEQVNIEKLSFQEKLKMFDISAKK